MAGPVPYRVVRFPEVGSTNDIVLEAARAGEPSGLVVVAGIQARGRGRKAQDWRSPPGGLWASILLRANPPAHLAGTIPLAVGLAACEALEGLGASLELRWPNDLMVGDRKLGGVLVESRSGSQGIETVVAGLGINVNNEPPIDDAASLAQLGVEATPREVLTALLDALPAYEAMLERTDVNAICERFMAKAWGIEREMTMDGEPCIPKEIAVDGALIIELTDGTIDVRRTGSLRLPGPSVAGE